jgi:ribA/ribD-fused uncharacterized protein
MAIIIKNVNWMKNDYPVEITVAGIKYPTVEHAYQASKFTDEDLKLQIANSSIKTAVKIGRSSKITTPSWENNRLIIMQILLRQKFSILLHSGLAEHLANTGKAEIQGVGLDEFWGLIDEALDDSYNDFTGENNLGIILMEIRNEVQFLLGKNTQHFDYSKALEDKLNNQDNLLIKSIVELFTLLGKEDSSDFSNFNYYLPAASNHYKMIKSIIDESYVQKTSEKDSEENNVLYESEYEEYDIFDNEYDSYDNGPIRAAIADEYIDITDYENN